MNSHDKLRAQIRAGRELLGFKQSDIADLLGVSLSKISRAESGETKSGDVLLEIKGGLEREGIRFTTGGVERVETSIEIIEGEGYYLKVLLDAYNTLMRLPVAERECLLMFATDRVSSPAVNDRYRLMHKDGIRLRQIIEEGDDYIMGALDDYRTIPGKYFTNVVTLVYSEKVAQMDGSRTRATIHKDTVLAQRDRKFFHFLWDNGTKPVTSTAKERIIPA